MHMRTLIIAAAVALASIGLAVAAAPAHAGAPDRFLFVDDYTYEDNSCGFPIAVEGEFVNRVIDTSFATGTGRAELHQSNVATATAKGVTLREEAHYTILVDIVDGVPVTATHVGLLDELRGPNGEHLFFRTGLDRYRVVFDPDIGFYVDGPQITRHGIRDNFDQDEFCAAFG
jgi:hypothetical protein